MISAASRQPAFWEQDRTHSSGRTAVSTRRTVRSAQLMPALAALLVCGGDGRCCNRWSGPAPRDAERDSSGGRDNDPTRARAATVWGTRRPHDGHTRVKTATSAFSAGSGRGSTCDAETNRRPFEQRERVARRPRPVYRASAPGAASSSRVRGARRTATAPARSPRPPMSPRADVERGIAAALARHRRIEQHGRHAGGQRLERRQPEPFVLGQKRERRAPVQSGAELVVGHVPRQCARPSRPARRWRRPDSPVGMLRLSPTMSRDASGCARATAPNARIEIRHVAAVEDRADVEHRTAGGRWCGRDATGAVDARRNHVDPRVGDAEALDELAPRELRDRDDRPRLLAARRQISRRRSPSRAENHSGCAANETSWIADDGRDARGERRRVGRREEDVEVIARRDRAAAAPAPTRCRRRPRRPASAKRRASRARRAARGRTARTRAGARLVDAHSRSSPFR